MILLSEQLVERRVLEGALGCPNCRDQFPIQEGFADLRPPPRGPLTVPTLTDEPGGEETERLAALIGVFEGPGNVALLGSTVAHAAALADLLPEIEVVAIGAAAQAHAERERVSRLVSGAELPFQSWTFRALAAVGGGVAPEEAVRVVGRGGRVVMERPDPDVAERLERAGSRILLEEDGWLAALCEAR